MKKRKRITVVVLSVVAVILLIIAILPDLLLSSVDKCPNASISMLGVISKKGSHTACRFLVDIYENLYSDLEVQLSQSSKDVLSQNYIRVLHEQQIDGDLKSLNKLIVVYLRNLRSNGHNIDYLERLIALLDRGASLGDKKSKVWFALAHRDAIGVPENVEIAKELFISGIDGSGMISTQQLEAEVISKLLDSSQDAETIRETPLTPNGPHWVIQILIDWNNYVHGKNYYQYLPADFPDPFEVESNETDE